jgi:hypothetical protein
MNPLSMTAKELLAATHPAARDGELSMTVDELLTLCYNLRKGRPSRKEGPPG